MRDPIIERKVYLPTGFNAVMTGEDLDVIRGWPIAEMRTQIGYRRHLVKIGADNEAFSINSDNYRHARDAALALGLRVDNFPKSLGGIAA